MQLDRFTYVLYLCCFASFEQCDRQAHYIFLGKKVWSSVWDDNPLPPSTQFWEKEGVAVYPARSAQLILVMNGMTNVTARSLLPPTNKPMSQHSNYKTNLPLSK